MITIQEKKNSKIPGTSSLFVSFPYNAEIITNIKSLSTYNYDKNTHEWEIPVTSLAEIVDKLSPFDDIEMSFMEYKEKSDSEKQKTAGDFLQFLVSLFFCLFEFPVSCV